MTVIDHNFFPHLIDLIWENLDFEGQIAARRACKQWRRRANARLQHIVLSCFERPGDVIDIATRDLSKPSSHAWLGQICHWHDSREHEWAHYGYYYDHDDWGRRKKFKYTEAEKLANRLEYKVSTSAKVVDFVGFDQGRPYVPSNLSYNSFIQAVLLESRCIVRWYGHFPDLSDFQDFALNSFHTDLPPSLIDVFMFELKPDTPFDSLSSWELEERDTVQVANYLCLCDPTASDSGMISLWNENRNMEVCPVTVIFENGLPQENRAAHGSGVNVLLRHLCPLSTFPLGPLLVLTSSSF